MKAFFVSPYLTDGSTGGGLVSRMNLQLLQQTTQVAQAYALCHQAPTEVDYRWAPAPSGRWATAGCNLLLLAGRLTPRALWSITRQIRVEQPDMLFLDSSSMGWLVVLCRLVSPRTRIISFFHNIEFDFQLEHSRIEGRQYWLTAVAEYCNERLTTKWAHRLLMLTSEDSRRAQQLYGRPAELLTPVVLNDTASTPPTSAAEGSVIGLLFVGSNFFANRQAVHFLLEQLAPSLANQSHIEIWIAGSGFSAEQWSGVIPANVRMHGRVADLSVLYQVATAVVVPITTGAGMKVKVAEALMHGCPVIGTPLALRGYLDDTRCTRPPATHLQCATTPHEYLSALQLILADRQRLREEARQDYEQRFSLAAGLQRFQHLLAEV